MTYSVWYESHVTKRNALICSLKESGFSDRDIVDYFKWSNMVKVQPTYCGLYAENKKCHTLNELNCLFCACPYFKYNDAGLFEDEGKTVFSLCSIDSKFGTDFVHECSVHQDCSLCLIPHTKHFAYKYITEINLKERN
jgi:Zn-finger protein